MKKLILFLSLCAGAGLFGTLIIQAAGALPAKKYTKAQAEAILREAEEIRSLEKAEILVDLKTVSGKQETTYDMKILRSTERRAFIDFVGPPEERGRKMLAKGQSYWSTFPDSKRVVAISRREMIGNSAFALADIFQLDAENDYDTEIVGEEKEGATDLLKLELKGKHDEAPYARIEYWVETKGSFPVKARFYSTSGKHLKTMTVESRKEIAGRLRPEVSKMVDEVTVGRVSWWKTRAMTPANVPDQIFSKDYLKSGG
jgi:outer membrane lipoprotein-sorting protein